MPNVVRRQSPSTKFITVSDEHRFFGIMLGLGGNPIDSVRRRLKWIRKVEPRLIASGTSSKSRACINTKRKKKTSFEVQDEKEDGRVEKFHKNEMVEI